MRFLLDEHMPASIGNALLQRVPDLVVVEIGRPGAPPKGTPDPDILDWCEQTDTILLTNNRRTMPVHLRAHLRAGRHMPGILVVNLAAPFRNILADLLLVTGASTADEYRDRVVFVPL